MRRIQASFVRSVEPHRALDPILPELLALCESEYGFIGEVWHDEPGVPYLRIFTMTNIAWDDASRERVERERVRGIEFRNLKTLFGAALVTAQPVIANDAPNDPRAGRGMPSGHLPLNSFLGLPLHYGGEMVGMVGLANRPGGYDTAMLERLDPMFQAVAGVIAAVQLDRQRRAAEARLSENDRRWHTNLELCGVGIVRVDPQRRFIEVNARMCELVGRPAEELLAMRADELTHPDDRAAWAAQMQPLVRGEIHHLLGEKRYLRGDGSSVWVQLALTAARDARGEFLYTVAIVSDIDQRKRAEAELRAREAQFVKLASKVPGVLLQFRIDTADRATVPYASEGMRDLFELDPEGPVRQDARLMMERVVKGQRGKVWGTLEACGRALAPWALEWEVELPLRGRRWVLGRGTPERLADGATLWHGYIDDITERKRYEEAVVAAEASVRANAAKTEFLSRMSHELRTPLNAVLGFAQLLASDPHAPLADTQRARIAHIEHAGQHLLAMIGDVLDLSRIESGSLPLSIGPVPVRKLIEDSFALVAPTARAGGVRLEVGGSASLAGLQVRADAMRLRQVLVNLLSNAIKYNRPGGRVTVAIDTALDRVSLAVTDTGFGLTPAQQAHLFEPFNRLGAERGSVDGTGLGLAITLRLVELMAGSITVHSESDRGSTFVVDLPCDDTPAPPEPAAPAAPAAPRAAAGPATLTVLYAEDNELNVELMRQLLTLRPGCALSIARNGREAIELARSAPAPQLLLIDMHLGDMSGLQVLEALRDEPALAGVPRVALSADALPQSIRAARDAGFDEYLTKPVDVERLLALLDGHGAVAPVAA
ncbi:MAG TPA: ATP-binding protein [Methylibium sp.]|uniref:ATP-binding protein n=1 Tax=Methylibium sp. TaxID=2067992 RepID=UPI002DBE8BE7|nr:ATP-binding protein [Methylibium sp.]HEU4459455.1 ATP-binding protein [Methylibium sp.]